MHQLQGRIRGISLRQVQSMDESGRIFHCLVEECFWSIFVAWDNSRCAQENSLLTLYLLVMIAFVHRFIHRRIVQKTLSL